MVWKIICGQVSGLKNLLGIQTRADYLNKNSSKTSIEMHYVHMENSKNLVNIRNQLKLFDMTYLHL